MNNRILNNDIQEFISENLNSKISGLLLKGLPFEAIDPKEIIEQIEAKKRCKAKLSTWYNTKCIYYPNKLNIEQTSSEITASYKANLVSGNSLVDVTGGFGVDAYYFSKKVASVIHCEVDKHLSQIVSYNYRILDVTNIECLNDNGIDVLKQKNKAFEWIYVDPSRRDDKKNKVFLLSDATPNIKTFQGLFLKYAEHVMIKTSPLLDIKATLKDLSFVKELHVVAVNNEVKELLWLLERDFQDDVRVKTINLSNEKQQLFEFKYKDESEASIEYNTPLTYLYEPNSAILKSGAFNAVGFAFNAFKLHKHSHLYTSEELIDFPGRRFKIEKSIPFNKKAFSKEGIKKANVTTRNFPIPVSKIRKDLKIKDGGSIYLFFTTIWHTNQKVIIICSKA
ncbi:THUMP-like domain-containing protein [Winogradskyella aurantia]|uniref:SAM-dependent methyltransferase n=1 Tax=Winogradskyella aurantia TaxID=1915063 RepID=A0A265UU60_9FLAO|nr:SAM-dependent methyltransferase [Winogradskyella aurantia]OZV68607.1 SAM-dependent methyltransferase [Winogradskyella aurantia]